MARYNRAITMGDVARVSIESSQLYILPFKYQLFWIRVISILPILFILSWVEYKLIGRYTNSILFVLISICITFIFVFAAFKPIGHIFVREGTIKVSDCEFHLIKGNSEVTSCNIQEINAVEVDRINLYGSTFDKMVIHGPSIRIAFYSEEMREDSDKMSNTKYCSFNEIANTLNSVINMS